MILENKLLGEFDFEYFQEIDERLRNYGVIYGEFSPQNLFDISLSNVSHTIENLYYVDNKIYGNIHLLNTNNGNLVKKLIEQGFKLKIKPRIFHPIRKILTFDLSIYSKIDSRKEKIKRILFEKDPEVIL
jgi:hypothetical protein